MIAIGGGGYVPARILRYVPRLPEIPRCREHAACVMVNKALRETTYS